MKLNYPTFDNPTFRAIRRHPAWLKKNGDKIMSVNLLASVSVPTVVAIESTATPKVSLQTVHCLWSLS